MEHTEFVQRCGDPRYTWGIRHRPLLRAAGPFGLAVIVALAAVGLAPAIVYFTVAVQNGHYLQLLWAPFVLLALSLSVPSLNLIQALPWWLVAIAAGQAARWFGQGVEAGGVLCLATWYVGGVLRSIAMSALRARLLRNARLFTRYRDAGCLLLPEG